MHKPKPKVYKVYLAVDEPTQDRIIALADRTRLPITAVLRLALERALPQLEGDYSIGANEGSPHPSESLEGRLQNIEARLNSLENHNRYKNNQEGIPV